MPALVIEAEPLHPVPRAWLAERCDVETCDPGDAHFTELLSRADGLVVRTYTTVDESLIGAAPRLRVVGRAGVGIDNIDVQACEARGIVVVNTPGANTRAVVEFVARTLLQTARRIESLDQAWSRENWNASRERCSGSSELAGRTLGILGLGRIGSQVARLGAAFDMRVIYHDLVAIADPGPATRVEFDELLGTSDVLSLHVDGRPENRGLLGTAQFARMQEDVVLINSSRGIVVDASACAEFLRSHAPARAIIDVHDPEPVESSSPLLGVSNALLTPHIAGATSIAKENMSWVVRDVWNALE